MSLRISPLLKQQQQATAISHIKELERERDRATNAMAALAVENDAEPAAAGMGCAYAAGIWECLVGRLQLAEIMDSP